MYHIGGLSIDCSKIKTKQNELTNKQTNPKNYLDLFILIVQINEIQKLARRTMFFQSVASRSTGTW